MDLAAISSQSSAMTKGQVSEAVGTLMLRKALDIQEQNAMQLLQALPQTPSNPPHLGNGIDVKA